MPCTDKGIGSEAIAQPSYGLYLKRARQARGWTLAEAARETGVSASQIMRIEQGKHLPQTRVIHRLSQAFGNVGASYHPSAANGLVVSESRAQSALGALLDALERADDAQQRKQLVQAVRQLTKP